MSLNKYCMHIRKVKIVKKDKEIAHVLKSNREVYFSIKNSSVHTEAEKYTAVKHLYTKLD